MAYISLPCRVLYESRGHVNGLNNVYAYSMAPDKTVRGPFPMVEAPFPFFGRYFFDFLTHIGDPQGEYFFMVNSPSEGISQTLRIPIYSLPPGAQPGGRVDKTLIQGRLAPNPTIVGQFDVQDELNVEIKENLSMGNVTNKNLSGEVETKIIKGSSYERLP